MRKRIVTKTILKVSEKMLEKWKQMPIVVALTGDGLVGTAMNTASYSGYVQGEKQATFHQETGWLTTTEAEEKHHTQIVDGFVQHAMKLIGGEVL